MTIEVAIEILTDMAEDNDLETEKGALLLGIEALKRIQSQRSPHPNDTYQPLPGETDS